MSLGYGNLALLFLIPLFSFLNDIQRIASSNYEPSDDDIVRARLRTVGLQEHKFTMDEGGYIMSPALPRMLDHIPQVKAGNGSCTTLGAQDLL